MAVRQMLVAGRYRLLEPVGAGGMGRVWLARDQMLDRDVAVKEIVPPGWMSDAEKDRLHNRTLREARSAARLTHPHVVRVYDVVHAEGLSWIVMEYVASRSLYQVLISKGPYPPIEAARIGLAVLDALTAAHRAGVLHRDVKPHNVLIGSDGRVLLTDFGLATFVDDGIITTPGLIVGSPQYVSPERARDGASTMESDLWSFGATLYATVEGQSPYARDSAMATLAALATELPDPPRLAGPLVPILEGLLQYDPAARLSAGETERRLRAVLGEEPSGPRRAPQPEVVPPSDENTEELVVEGLLLADLDTPNLTDSDQSLMLALPAPPGLRELAATPAPLPAPSLALAPAPAGALARRSAAAPPTSAPSAAPPAPAPGAAPPTPAPAAPARGPVPDAIPAAGSASVPAPAPASASASAEEQPPLAEEQPKDGEDSDEWWRNPGGSDEVARSRYIEGTFTSGDEAFTRVGAHYAAAREPAGRSHAGAEGNRDGVGAGSGRATDADREAGVAGASTRGAAGGGSRGAGGATGSGHGAGGVGVGSRGGTGEGDRSSDDAGEGGGVSGGPGRRRPRPNRRPSAAEPTTNSSARRGNQVLLRSIPSPRSPVSGPITANQPPPRRWSRNPHPTTRTRTRLILAGLVTAVLLGGGLFSFHLIAQQNSAPPVITPPTQSSSVDSSPPRASPSHTSSQASAPAGPAVSQLSSNSSASPSRLPEGPSTSRSPQGPSTSRLPEGPPASRLPGGSSASRLPGGASGSRLPGGASGSQLPVGPSARVSAGPSGSRSAVGTSAGGFSPIVCDARPPSRVPAAPKENAPRGVNGWELQTGWSYFTDGTGFHIPVPDGWTYQRIGTTYCFRDPRTTRVLSLDVGRRPDTDPREGCRAEDHRLQKSGRVRDYTSITISPVALLNEAADWDYRYRTAAGVLRRATTRWFATGGRAYALGWATPESSWAAELGKIQMIRGTFYADPTSAPTNS